MNFLINIDVPNLEAGIAFYRDGLGFSLARRLKPAIAEMAGGPAPVYLIARAAGSPVAPGLAAGRDFGRHWTPVHLDMLVEDVDRAAGRAVAAGAKLEAPAGDFPFGRLALMSDPFGNGFCLLTLSGPGYDAIAL